MPQIQPRSVNCQARSNCRTNVFGSSPYSWSDIICWARQIPQWKRFIADRTSDRRPPTDAHRNKSFCQYSWGQEFWTTYDDFGQGHRQHNFSAIIKALSQNWCVPHRALRWTYFLVEINKRTSVHLLISTRKFHHRTYEALRTLGIIYTSAPTSFNTNFTERFTYVRSAVITAIAKEFNAFWDMILCRLVHMTFRSNVGYSVHIHSSTWKDLRNSRIVYASVDRQALTLQGWCPYKLQIQLLPLPPLIQLLLPLLLIVILPPPGMV